MPEAGMFSVESSLAEAERLLLAPTAQNAGDAVAILQRIADQASENKGFLPIVARERGRLRRLQVLFEAAWRTQLACLRLAEAGGGGYSPDARLTPVATASPSRAVTG